MTTPHSDGRELATYREVAGLMDRFRTEVMAEMKAMKASIDAQLVQHKSEHDAHETRHQQDHDRRSNLIRWAVTSLLTGLGVITAIYVAFMRGEG